MNGLIKKKLNLLVHLARVDNNFHRLERDMILTMAEELASPVSSADLAEFTSTNFPDVDDFDDKEEILFLAMKLCQADSVITTEEVEFCRQLAQRLDFPSSVVDRFLHVPLSNRATFEAELRTYLLTAR